MRWKKRIALIANRACTALIGLLLMACPSSSLNAQQPPWSEGCRPASKVEYNAAKRQYLLRNSFGGEYLRTGRLWRRYYWYCV